jgi:hypothetical protein
MIAVSPLLSAVPRHCFFLPLLRRQLAKFLVRFQGFEQHFAVPR